MLDEHQDTAEFQKETSQEADCSRCMLITFGLFQDCQWFRLSLFSFFFSHLLHMSHELPYSQKMFGDVVPSAQSGGASSAAPWRWNIQKRLISKRIPVRLFSVWDYSPASAMLLPQLNKSTLQRFLSFGIFNGVKGLWMITARHKDKGKEKRMKKTMLLRKNRKSNNIIIKLTDRRLSSWIKGVPKKKKSITTVQITVAFYCVNAQIKSLARFSKKLALKEPNPGADIHFYKHKFSLTPFCRTIHAAICKTLDTHVYVRHRCWSSVQFQSSWAINLHTH